MRKCHLNTCPVGIATQVGIYIDIFASLYPGMYLYLSVSVSISILYISDAQVPPQHLSSWHCYAGKHIYIYTFMDR